MLNIEEILKQFPPHLQKFRRGALREYLQYKILESIFRSKYANQLVFLGGTALRIIYNNNRFSEDLDFDNLGINENDFANLGLCIKKDLEQEGYKIEIKNVYKGAYHCYIKIPDILFQNNISPLKEEKILIQVDTVPQNFDYKPEQKILNKFDVFTQINVTPKDLLLSQKFFAAFDRKRPKGRDFYDIVFLLSLGANPNYAYLEKNLNLKTGAELKKYVLEKSQTLNFAQLAQDVSSFLFSAKDSEKILLFREFIETREF